jgi:hypothetical protein
MSSQLSSGVTSINALPHRNIKDLEYFAVSNILSDQVPVFCKMPLLVASHMYPSNAQGLHMSGNSIIGKDGRVDPLADFPSESRTEQISPMLVDQIKPSDSNTELVSTVQNFGFSTNSPTLQNAGMECSHLRSHEKQKALGENSALTASSGHDIGFLEDNSSVRAGNTTIRQTSRKGLLSEYGETEDHPSRVHACHLDRNWASESTLPGQPTDSEIFQSFHLPQSVRAPCYVTSCSASFTSESVYETS